VIGLLSAHEAEQVTSDRLKQNIHSWPALWMLAQRTDARVKRLSIATASQRQVPCFDAQWVWRLVSRQKCGGRLRWGA